MITINLDNHSNIPLYEQIYSFIKNEIRIGSLPYGNKLPSTRSLSSHLNVSRNTVDLAYSQLLSEGYIESLPKSGYYVCQVEELAIPSESKQSKTHFTQIQEQNYLYNFSPFAVDLDHFPYHTWRQLSKNCLSENNLLFLSGNNQGDEAFRYAIETYLHQSRGVNCTKEQIIIGAGVDYLLQLLINLLHRNRMIAMENPAYKRAYKIFNGLDCQTIPISLDEKGMNINELESCSADIAYVTPSHQYPLGVVMPISRRMELLNWASSKPERYIIEDDHDSEFRYKGKPIPALQGIDTHEKVIYIGTFSKAIAPAIRVGYMVLPYPLLEIYHNEFDYFASTVSRIDQSILTSFIEQGYFERHLNRMRKIYKSKHDALINALKIFGNNIDISGENAGMHLVLKLKTTLSEEEIIEKAALSGIKLYGLAEHFIHLPNDYSPSLLLGYANLTEDQIQSGIKLLHQTLNTTSN